MLRNKLKWLILLLTLWSMLSACAGAPTSTTVAAPRNLTELIVNPADGSLLGADATGLFHLAPDGQTWEAVSLPAVASLTGIALNPEAPATFYVSGLDVGILKSTDGGQSWSPINNGLPTTEVSTLAMHSFRRETLYVWLQGDGIYRTEDGGENWKRMPDQGPPDKAVRGLTHSTLPGSMNTGWLYAATPTGVYLSMDCF
jgi:photosystem II stability/assembly factor-like uncharacterized protein